MKKRLKKKSSDDRFQKMYRRNWLISIVILGLVIFFMYFYPNMSGGGG